MKRKSLIVMVLLVFVLATAAWAGWHSEIREMLFKGTVIFEKGVTFNQTPTFVTGLTSTTAPTMSALTASKPVFTDASKALTSSGTLGVDQGGTNLTSYTAGDLLYASGATTLSKLAKGTAYQTLQMNSGATAPAWASGETLLSTTTISLGADGNTTILTVPASRTAVLTKAYLVAAADAGTSTLTIGQAGALTDFLGTQTLSAIDAAGDVGFLCPVPNATTPKIESYAAGTVIKAVVGSHAGSAGNTLYLFGFLY
jgi:hypothetical protein